MLPEATAYAFRLCLCVRSVGCGTPETEAVVSSTETGEHPAETSPDPNLPGSEQASDATGTALCTGEVTARRIHTVESFAGMEGPTKLASIGSDIAVAWQTEHNTASGSPFPKMMRWMQLNHAGETTFGPYRIGHTRTNWGFQSTFASDGLTPAIGFRSHEYHSGWAVFFRRISTYAEVGNPIPDHRASVANNAFAPTIEWSGREYLYAFNQDGRIGFLRYDERSTPVSLGSNADPDGEHRAPSTMTTSAWAVARPTSRRFCTTATPSRWWSVRARIRVSSAMTEQRMLSSARVQTWASRTHEASFAMA